MRNNKDDGQGNQHDDFKLVRRVCEEESRFVTNDHLHWTHVSKRSELTPFDQRTAALYSALPNGWHLHFEWKINNEGHILFKVFDIE